MFHNIEIKRQSPFAHIWIARCSCGWAEMGDRYYVEAVAGSHDIKDIGQFEAVALRRDERK